VVGTANRAVHSSGVNKLVAVSIQWVTTIEVCEGQCVRAVVRWLACSRRRKLPHVGFLPSARASLDVTILKAPNKFRINLTLPYLLEKSNSTFYFLVAIFRSSLTFHELFECFENRKFSITDSICGLREF
jgi:hypothetical protein